jgi:gliding motility-associated lipoprotein GldH
MTKLLKNLPAILICYLGTATIMACQDSLHYTEYKHLPHKQWDSRDTLIYHIPPLQHDADISITLGIRCSKDFKYERIVAQAELRCDSLITAATPVILHLDNDSLPFRHPNSDCLSTPISLPMKANRPYTLRITHSMRLNPLDGIPCVGVFLER